MVAVVTAPFVHSRHGRIDADGNAVADYVSVVAASVAVVVVASVPVAAAAVPSVPIVDAASVSITASVAAVVAAVA